MQPLNGFKTKKREKRWYGRGSRRLPQNLVEVSWPCWHWYADTRLFQPGADALRRVCEAALEDGVNVAKAVRCAEAAGLFRKGHRRDGAGLNQLRGR